MIRPATPEDAPGLLAIYAPLVRTSHVSFELEPPEEDALRARIGGAPDGSPWLVWEEGGEILGHAFAVRSRRALANSLVGKNRTAQPGTRG